MSLQVWLPLNGDLKNKGCADITVTNNGATVADDGKIGKCYAFNGSAQFLEFDKSLGDIYSGDFTLALWIKPEDNTRGVLISEYASTGSSNVALELLANRVVRVYWNGSPDWNTSYTITLNTWTHVAVTKTASLLKLYVNGVEVAQRTGTLSNRPSTSKIRIGDDYRGGTSVSYKGKINDVRIYDHCLSTIEIKEISKGLVAHISYNDTSLTSNKLCDTSGYGYHGTCTNASRPVITTDSPRRTRCVKFDTTSKYVRISNLPALGNNYTFAWWGWWPNSTAAIMFWGYTNGNRYNMYRSSSKLYNNTSDGSQNPFYTTGTTVAPAVGLGTWAHYAITGDGTSNKLYVNGSLYATAKTFKAITGTKITMPGWDTGKSYKGAGTEISDFRIYSTTLSAEDVRQLYEVSAKIDDSGNLHSYEFDELSVGRELLAGENFIHYSNGTFWNDFSSEGLEFQYGNSLKSNYIEINPDGNKYLYDFTVSVATGNQFYIGFERYDENKTSRSNNACVYAVSTKPSSDIVKRRYKGVINLATDGVNPCKYIKLRVLNGWTGSNSSSTKLATIHNLSLREVPTSTTAKSKLYKTGIFESDLLLEGNTKVEIEKNIDTISNQFIET